MKIFLLPTGQQIGARLLRLCFLLFCSFSLVLIAGCLPQGDKGTLTIDFSVNNGRSILPDFDMDISRYDVRGTGPDGATFSVSTMESSVTIDDIVLGTWVIEVDGLNAEGTLIGFGQGETTLVNSLGTTCYITIRPLAGEGALALTVTWGDYEGTVQITSQLISRISGATPIPVEFNIGTDSATYTNNAIPTGYYDLTLVISNGVRDIGGAMETVRIVNDVTTSATINVTINEGGDATIDIVEDMNDPINVVLTGQLNLLQVGDSMTVTANGENITADEEPVYRWYLNGALMQSGATATFGSSLLIGTYRLDVSIFSGDGERGGSATHTFTVVDEAEYIYAPENLSALSGSTTSINLEWDDMSGNETGFRIERKMGESGSFVEIAAVAANVTAYSDEGLSSGTTYFYRVLAYNSSYLSNYSDLVSATTSVEAQNQIIADHTVVDRYDDIPEYYINEVKKMLVDIAGESHSGAYRIGQDLLELYNATYQVTTYDGTRPAYSDQYLRIGRHGSVGEATFYTTQAAIDAYKAHVTTQYNTGNPYTVMGFGWCWDMVWHSYTNINGTNERDAVYNVHWFGSSEGGPEGDYIWGLDAADQTITGNSVCMDTYLDAVEQYNQYCVVNGYSTIVVFTTGPVDGNSGTENGFQREIKHNYIRNYVAADSSRILFDYADILCWSNAGAQNVVTWDDNGNARTHAQIHPDNMLDYDAAWNEIAITEDGDHIGEVGALRLAKAMWWMLARIAGWDGVSTD